MRLGTKSLGIGILGQMLHYALLAYFITGAIKPSAESIRELGTQQFPGTFNFEDTQDPDEVYFTRVISASDLYNRGVDVAFILSVLGVILFFGIALFALVPAFLIALVFFTFGPVVLVSSLWSFAAGLCACLVLGVNLSARYWIVIVQACTEAARDRFGAEALEAAIRSAYDNLAIAYSRRQPEHVKHGGRVWRLDDLVDRKLDASERYAVATYWLYCPTRYERGSVTVFTASLVALYFWRAAYMHLKRWLRISYLAFRLWLIVLVVCTCGSDRLVSAIGDIVSYFVVAVLWPCIRYLLAGDFRSAVRFCRILYLLAAIKLLALGHRLNILAARKKADVLGYTSSSVKWRALWNNALVDLARQIDKISVPNFIRSLPDRFDRDAINDGMAILEELGWPAAPPITEEFNDEPANIGLFLDNVVGGSVIRQGIHRAELSVAKELANLAGLAPEYKRTEQYATVEAELASLSRYFEAPEGDFPELPIDDIWLMVSEIFENSKLTPFSYILKKWEKKYGLGPLWGSTNSKGKFRKTSRKSFIKSIGGMGKMLKLWADTFYTAHLVPAPAPVSVKSEALPPKKWMFDKVRTIIGAPITHYISSTLWNYMPNHNFKFWSTGIKIGMPLNGACLSRLLRQHSTYDFHFGGDFSDFDSTLRGEVLKIVAKVRKKGFEHHRDYAKICFLIDANYQGLLRQPMMTTSTGNVYSKSSGLSTGHSSTGMDNSLALTVLYLLAWRKVTGLSAHEFRHYNKLSNYGDDHLLSWLATAPPSWTPSNIIKAMAAMNTTLRDEFPKLDTAGQPVTKTLNDYRRLDNLEFLSKIWRRPTANDYVEMAAAGLQAPEWLIVHNPAKLVGKAYAPSKDARVNRDYRMKRLVAYMGLCAHQQELYDKLAADLLTLRTRRDGTLMPCPVPVPTYNDVLVNWYNESSHIVAEDEEAADPESSMVLDYSLDGLADTVVNILSIVPDVLNPAIYNMGYVNWVVATFGTHVAWPVELIRRANSVSAPGALTAIGKRTCYDFLFENPRVVAQDVKASNSDLVFRHWVYMILRPKATKVSPFVFLQWLDKKVAEANFLANGYVQPYVKRFDLPIRELVLIALLDYLPGPPMPQVLFNLHLPTAGSVVEFFYGYALNSLWNSVPANMKDSYSAIDTLSEDECSVLIEAPTGTGKSTTFVNYVWRFFGYRYTRVIVVLPRSLLVTTLTPYLESAFGLPACAVTDGHPYQPTFRLVVTTPQEVLLHEEWLREGNLFMVDEAHIEEPAVVAVRDILLDLKHPHIMMTATPSGDLLDTCSRHVALRIASTWTIVDDDAPEHIIRDDTPSERMYWLRYRARVLDMVRFRTLSRILVFVANRSHARELAARMNRRTCTLTASDKIIDPNAEVFIATSVADVGLTIPDVDWVITSDLTRVKDPVTDELLWVHCDQLLLKQRRGRTGRTSNGLFTVIRFPRASFASDPPHWTKAEIGLEVLRSTGNANMVHQFWPQTMARILALDVATAEATTHIDGFIKNFETLVEVMEPAQQRTFRLTTDGVAETNYWHIAGNTLPTAIPALDPDTIGGLPLTIRQGFDFMVGAAHLAASTGMTLNADHLRYYIRTDHISAAKFRAWLLADRGQSAAEMAERWGSDPSGRFGTRRPPYDFEAETHESLFDSFSTFADPKPVGQLGVRAPSRAPAGQTGILTSAGLAHSQIAQPAPASSRVPSPESDDGFDSSDGEMPIAVGPHAHIPDPSTLPEIDLGSEDESGTDSDSSSDAPPDPPMLEGVQPQATGSAYAHVPDPSTLPEIDLGSEDESGIDSDSSSDAPPDPQGPEIVPPQVVGSAYAHIPDPSTLPEIDLGSDSDVSGTDSSEENSDDESD